MKRVLFINHSANMHGAETVLFQLLIKLFKDNKNFAYVTEPANTNSSFKKKLNEHGLKCMDLPYKNIGGSALRSLIVLIYNLFAMCKLCYLVKKRKIDIIYSNTSTTCIGVFVAKLTGKKHIWHFHEPIEKAHDWVSSLRPFYKLLLSYKKNIVVFVSKQQQQQWMTQLPKSFKNHQLIYNPIQKIQFIEKQNKKELVFGYMGSRDKRKNIPFLLKTFISLSETYPNIKLILGQNIGNDNEQIHKIIEQSDIQDKIIEKKYDDASEFYSDIDVFVLPSLSETWGLVALEALSAKKALILTTNTGLHELLENDIDCIYVNPLSDMELYQAMEKLLTNKSYRQQLTQNGFEKIKKMDFNNQFRNSFSLLFN